jgi:hypothetical protein
MGPHVSADPLARDVIKVLLKLVVAALVANAAWRLGSAYLAYYRFTDAVQATTQYRGDKSDAQLQSRILELAAQYDVPLAPDAFTVRRDESHTIVDGSFKKPVELLPGYAYPWAFTWHTDTFVVK